jgi:hypothetical protein
MKYVYRLSISFAFLAVSALAAEPARTPDRGKPGDAKPAVKKAIRPKITISKETTYITAPLRPDGYVDYLAAINDLGRRGVTVENNAVVLLCQAFGPSGIENSAQRPGFFRLLGIPPPPEKGDYLVSFRKFAEEANLPGKTLGEQPRSKSDEELRTRLDAAMRRPWSATEFPDLARWLQRNEKPLALVVEATRRPRYYAPRVAIGEDTMIVASSTIEFTKCLEATRAMEARAMLRLGEGRAEEAWQDLLTCHRLARLYGHGPTSVDAILAYVLDQRACIGDAAFAHHATLTAAQYKRLEADLRALPPLPNVAEKVDICERYMYLDAALAYARQGPSSIVPCWTPRSILESRVWLDVLIFLHSPPIPWLIDSLSPVLVDWNETLRAVNAWHDRLAAVAKMANRAERRAAVKDVERDEKAMASRVRDIRAPLVSILAGKAPGPILGKKMAETILWLLMPPLRHFVSSEDRAAARFDMTRVALALAAYRANHGAFPEKLADLAPKYIPAVPKDVFSDADLHYSRQPGGYLLYSVGPNGKDDDGHNRDELPPGDGNPERQDWDDIVIRTPPEPQKQK